MRPRQACAMPLSHTAQWARGHMGRVECLCPTSLESAGAPTVVSRRMGRPRPVPTVRDGPRLTAHGQAKRAPRSAHRAAEGEWSNLPSTTMAAGGSRACLSEAPTMSTRTAQSEAAAGPRAGKRSGNGTSSAPWGQPPVTTTAETSGQRLPRSAKAGQGTCMGARLGACRHRRPSSSAGCPWTSVRMIRDWPMVQGSSHARIMRACTASIPGLM
mmetsp:Transcript_30713/g.94048  ORF Transcript_30713/g.94048 Transcript_30713/m.94048 type:complete len:214 (-) Transcript_30713:758-1399(-)